MAMLGVGGVVDIEGNGLGRLPVVLAPQVQLECTAASGTNHVAPHSRRRVAGYNTRLPPRFFAHIRAKLLRAHLRSGLNLVSCAE